MAGPRRSSDAAERACWAGRARSRGLRRAGPDAGSGVGERAAQGRVWAGLREREGELGGSRAGPAWEKVKRWVGPGSKLGWVSFGFFSFSLSISIYSLFSTLIQTKVEFKYQFEFKPHSIN